MKPFWDMSEREVEETIERIGMDGWKKKIREDRATAPKALAAGSNPWSAPTLSVKRQRIIEELAPELATEMKEQAKAH
ncbi:MAG: hypothetical protein ACOC24_00935 [Desulfovibrionales bacterium]